MLFIIVSAAQVLSVRVVVGEKILSLLALAEDQVFVFG